MDDDDEQIPDDLPPATVDAAISDFILLEQARASGARPRRLEKVRRTIHSAGQFVYINATLPSMDTVTREVTTRELRDQLSEVLGRAMYAGERIGVTRNGKLAAVVVSVADLEALEAFEMSQDVAAYRAAKKTDDGERVSIAQLRAQPAS